MHNIRSSEVLLNLQTKLTLEKLCLLKQGISAVQKNAQNIFSKKTN